MTVEPDGLFELLRKIRYDCTAIQAKVTDALNLLAALNLPDTRAPRCGRCGYRPGVNMPSLAEHAHTAHGAPAPPHWM